MGVARSFLPGLARSLLPGGGEEFPSGWWRGVSIWGRVAGNLYLKCS